MSREPIAAPPSERYALTHSHFAPATHAQLAPHLHASPHWHLGVASDSNAWQPQVQVAPVQDAQVQTFETFDAVFMVDSSRVYGPFR